MTPEGQRFRRARHQPHAERLRIAEQDRRARGDRRRRLVARAQAVALAGHGRREAAPESCFRLVVEPRAGQHADGLGIPPGQRGRRADQHHRARGGDQARIVLDGGVEHPERLEPQAERHQRLRMAQPRRAPRLVRGCGAFGQGREPPGEQFRNRTVLQVEQAGNCGRGAEILHRVFAARQREEEASLHPAQRDILALHQDRDAEPGPEQRRAIDRARLPRQCRQRPGGRGADLDQRLAARLPNRHDAPGICHRQKDAARSLRLWAVRRDATRILDAPGCTAFQPPSRCPERQADPGTVGVLQRQQHRGRVAAGLQRNLLRAGEPAPQGRQIHLARRIEGHDEGSAKREHCRTGAGRKGQRDGGGRDSGVDSRCGTEFRGCGGLGEAWRRARDVLWRRRCRRRAGRLRERHGPLGWGHGGLCRCGLRQGCCRRHRCGRRRRGDTLQGARRRQGRNGGSCSGRRHGARDSCAGCRGRRRRRGRARGRNRCCGSWHRDHGTARGGSRRRRIGRRPLRSG